MSFKSEVIADSSGTWCSNSCRYATKLEAEQAGAELASRWFAVKQHRAAESTDPVNYKFDTERWKSVPLPVPEKAA
jgi:hypothetical protein